MVTYTYNLTDLVSNNSILIEHQLKLNINDNELIIPSCIDIQKNNTEFNCIFSDSLSNQEIEILNNIINEFISYSETEYKTDKNNKLIISTDKKDFGYGYTIISHDFCKKETWYQNSSAKNNITLSRINDFIYKFPYNKFNLNERQNSHNYIIGDKYLIPEFRYLYFECLESGTSSSNKGYIPIYNNIEFYDGTSKFICRNMEEVIIDVENGKLFNEYMLNYYKAKIYKNNTELNSSSLYKNSEFLRAIELGQSLNVAKNILDGDYFIDYNNQIVYFKENINENDIIKSDYYISTNSEFTLTKIQNFITKLIKAEAQFTSKCKVRDSLSLYFIKDNNIIKYNQYKTFKNYVDESNYSYPKIYYTENHEYLNNDKKLDLSEDITVFFWDYITNSIIDDNSMIKLKLDEDIPFFGDYSTISFYFELEDE